MAPTAFASTASREQVLHSLFGDHQSMAATGAERAAQWEVQVFCWAWLLVAVHGRWVVFRVLACLPAGSGVATVLHLWRA